MKEEDIATMTFKEAYKILIQSINAKDDSKNIYQQARYGTQNGITFDIYDYWDGYMKIKPKTGKVIHHNKTHSLTNIRTEIERREKVIKDWLIKEYADTSFIEARTK